MLSVIPTLKWDSTINKLIRQTFKFHMGLFYSLNVIQNLVQLCVHVNPLVKRRAARETCNSLPAVTLRRLPSTTRLRSRRMHSSLDRRACCVHVVHGDGTLCVLHVVWLWEWRTYSSTLHTLFPFFVCLLFWFLMKSHTNHPKCWQHKLQGQKANPPGAPFR